MVQYYPFKDFFHKTPNALFALTESRCNLTRRYEYDFASLLGVAKDGHIWWLLKDAIRLGAGFRPYVEDNLTLEPGLRATSRHALANEQILIGAFSDAKITIERPRMFERNGFHYVDAEDFLYWLSQYIAQTQVNIAFPNKLASEVRRTKSKAAALQPPIATHEFESLTLAFYDWFDKDFEELPHALRQRVDQEFFPMQWDTLSADERHSVALQLDYQHDPSTGQERQTWWNFTPRINELNSQITEWMSAATSTVPDIELNESRLREMQQELDRLKFKQQWAPDDYYPKRKLPDSDKEVATKIDYIAFPKAMKILADRLEATPEELAAWIFTGPEKGGIAAYLNANALNPAPRFYFNCMMDENYLSPLMACWFRQDDVDRFDPADRYITGAALIKRWSNQPGVLPESFIRAKIAESRLRDIHPIFGCTRGTQDDAIFPSLSSGLFLIAQVKKVEVEDALDPVTSEVNLDTSPKAPLEVSIQAATPPVPAEDPCAVFRQMEKLHPSEISISIVGEKSESGLSGSNMLEISARSVKRRVAVAQFGLVDRRNGSLTMPAAVLIGMAQQKKILRSKDSQAAIMKRLRILFRDRLGVETDPFTPHNTKTGWQPLFAIADNRGRADELAKQKAELRTVSLDQLQDQGFQFAGDEGIHTDNRTDAAEDWLNNNDLNHVA